MPWAKVHQAKLARTMQDYWPREMSQAGGALRGAVFKLYFAKLEHFAPVTVFRELGDTRAHSDRLPSLHDLCDRCRSRENVRIRQREEPVEVVAAKDFAEGDEAYWEEKINGPDGEFYREQRERLRNGQWLKIKTKSLSDTGPSNDSQQPTTPDSDNTGPSPSETESSGDYW